MKKAEIDVSKLQLQPVNATVEIGTIHQETAGGIAHKSGRMPCNRGGSDIWFTLRHNAGIEQGNEGAYFEADRVNKVVAVRPVIGAGANIMPVRYLAGSNTVSIHLGGVFKEHPKLRPLSKSFVTVTTGTDSTGTECMFILLATALTKAKTKESSGKPRKPREKRKDKDKNGTPAPDANDKNKPLPTDDKANNDMPEPIGDEEVAAAEENE